MRCIHHEFDLETWCAPIFQSSNPFGKRFGLPGDPDLSNDSLRPSAYIMRAAVTQFMTIGAEDRE